MQGRLPDADNGFMVKKDVEGLLTRCQTIISEKSTHIKSFHFRIPICIGYSSDLTPEEFESFVDQIQTVVDQKNRAIDSAMASSSSIGLFDANVLQSNAQQKSASEYYYTYTFYLYPNEDIQAQAQIQAWMQANAKQIQSLVDNKCLLMLPEWRNSPEWVNALKDYEDFIESGFRSMKLDAKQNAKSPSSPDECLTLDATRFLDSWKKQHPGQKPSIPLADAKETVKRKVVDFLFWGIKKDAPNTRASLLIHYASPSKAMLNMFPHMAALGYVAFSCVYQEFKKNKNMKKLGEQSMPSISSEAAQSSSGQSPSAPQAVPSPRNGSFYSDNSSATNSTDTSGEEDVLALLSKEGGKCVPNTDTRVKAIIKYTAELYKQGVEVRDAVKGAFSIEEMARAFSAPSSPTIDESEILAVNPTRVSGTLFADSSRLRANSQPSTPVPSVGSMPIVGS